MNCSLAGPYASRQRSTSPAWRRAAFSPRWSRLAWTIGCALYLLHVACAFEYYHHWSHAEAYASTARQTEEAVGLDWGGGLYVNYAFTLVWLADVGWWWMNAPSYLARPRWFDGAVHAFLGFIVFNATVVFANGFSRWFGVAAWVFLLVVLYAFRAARRRAGAEKLFQY